MVAIVRRPDGQDFYERVLTTANAAGVPFMVGGAFAFGRYTGIHRDTKDLDLFVRRNDALRLIKLFAEEGGEPELAFPHWLGKVYCGEHFIDVIFGSGNGIAEVDDEWFQHAVPEHLWGIPVKLIPAEEMIWSKSFVMERERYDGADIAHVLYERAADLDWPRVLRRFGPHWRVLLSHLVLFGFSYPSKRSTIPSWVMEDLFERCLAEQVAGGCPDPVCRGTLLSREQYLFDLEERGMRDARLGDECSMTPEEIAHWTAAIEGRQSTHRTTFEAEMLERIEFEREVG
jgi:hypothetical protein